jgi:hypothetical protein
MIRAEEAYPKRHVGRARKAAEYAAPMKELRLVSHPNGLQALPKSSDRIEEHRKRE